MRVYPTIRNSAATYFDTIFEDARLWIKMESQWGQGSKLAFMVGPSVFKSAIVGKIGMLSNEAEERLVAHSKAVVTVLLHIDLDEPSHAVFLKPMLELMPTFFETRLLIRRPRMKAALLGIVQEERFVSRSRYACCVKELPA